VIKLITLLKEIYNKPKAIFLGGPAGSGKSTIIKQLLPSDLTVINVDDTYEQMLKDSGLGMDIKNFTPDQLSQAAKMMSAARKTTDEKYLELTKNLKNIIIDGTAASINPIRKKKEQLEALGYDTMMLMLYVSPTISLERNKQRERSLLPGIILRTWRDVNSNIEGYQDLFGDDNFILINNNPKDTKNEYNPEEIKRLYFDTSSAKGKPKTPEEQAKSDEDAAKLNQDIKQMVSQLPSFDTLQSTQTKINKFLK
jgi:predicted kinase